MTKSCIVYKGIKVPVVGTEMVRGRERERRTRQPPPLVVL